VRLGQLHRNLAEVIGRCSPGEVCIERMFFAKGVKAALSFGHTRGVVLLTASLSGIPIFEYSALEVKKAVTGYGRAEKSQVLEMVKGILGIIHSLSPDSADALALAICHGNRSRWDVPVRMPRPAGHQKSSSAVAG
jgi:crossover junction endodeoxyribonuclease RuvC